MSFDLKISKGDIIISSDGLVTPIIDNEKLRQDIIKILLTKLGDNKFHQSYGSEVGALQIGHIQDRSLLELDLSSSAETAIRKLMGLQRQQARRQYLRPGEIISAILGVSIGRDLADPRMYNIFISVQTQALTTITESITIKII